MSLCVGWLLMTCFEGGSRGHRSIAVFLRLLDHDAGDSTILRKASNYKPIRRSVKFMMTLIFVEGICNVAVHARDMGVSLCLTFCAWCLTYKGNRGRI